MRLDELRSDFIKHQEHIDKSKKFHDGTRTTVEALDPKLGPETAACFDTVKLMQAWPSDVVSVGNQRNEALLHELEDAAEEISDLASHDANCPVRGTCTAVHPPPT